MSRYGRDAVFMDIDSLRPGVDFPAEIDRVLGSCAVVLTLIGPDWARGDDGRDRLHSPDDYVRQEVAAALEARRDGRVVLIPVLVGGAVHPSAKELPSDLVGLESIQALTLNEDYWEPSLRKLTRTVDKSIASQDPRRRLLGMRAITASAAVLVLALGVLGVIVVIVVSDHSRDRPEDKAASPGPTAAAPAMGESDRLLIEKLSLDSGTSQCDVIVRSPDVKAAIQCEVPRGAGKLAQARARRFAERKMLNRERQVVVAGARGYAGCGQGLPRTFEGYTNGRWLCRQTPVATGGQATLTWTNDDLLALFQMSLPADRGEVGRVAKRLGLIVE